MSDEKEHQVPAGDRLEDMLDIIKRLLDAGAEIHGMDGCCHYCPAYLIAGEPHSPDCAYVAACRVAKLFDGD